MADTPTIQYQPGTHKGMPVIWLSFAYNAALTAQIKKLPGAKWSQGQKCWYVPDTEANRTRFEMQPAPPMPVLAVLSPENKEALDNFIQQLVLKAYSKSTIKTYRNEFLQLLVLLKSTPVNSLTQKRLKDYFAYCHTTLQLSENTIHSRLYQL